MVYRPAGTYCSSTLYARGVTSVTDLVTEYGRGIRSVRLLTVLTARSTSTQRHRIKNQGSNKHLAPRQTETLGLRLARRSRHDRGRDTQSTLMSLIRSDPYAYPKSSSANRQGARYCASASPSMLYTYIRDISEESTLRVQTLTVE